MRVVPGNKAGLDVGTRVPALYQLSHIQAYAQTIRFELTTTILRGCSRFPGHQAPPHEVVAVPP